MITVKRNGQGIARAFASSIYPTRFAGCSS